MTTKFHKQFGEVKIISSDNMFTTIVIASSGEEKKLVNKFTILTDSPIETKKSITPINRNLTNQELEIVKNSVAKQMREVDYVNSLNTEQKAEYKNNKSKRTHC